MRLYALVLVVGIAVGLVISQMLGSSLKTQKRDHTSTTQTVTNTQVIIKDSIVYVPKPYPVYHTRTITKPIPYYIDTTNVELVASSKKNYRDTLTLEDSLYMHYDVVVRGELDTISLGVIDNRPEKVVYRNTITTLRSRPTGLYVTSSFGKNIAAPGLMYVRDKYSIQASYNLNIHPNNPTLILGLGYRIY